MIRDITICAVLNGFEVKVGCQTLVFTDVTEMLKEIRRYLKKPEEVEKEYLEKALNAKHLDFARPTTPSAVTYYPSYPQTSSAPTCITTGSSDNSSKNRWESVCNTSGLSNV